MQWKACVSSRVSIDS
jgi:hypothetical protein